MVVEASTATGSAVMQPLQNPITITENTLASEALILMKDKKITSIVITDSQDTKQIVGVIHLHHLLKEGLS